MLRAAPEVAYVLKLFGLEHNWKRQYKEHVLYRFMKVERARSSQQQNTRRFGDGRKSNTD